MYKHNNVIDQMDATRLNTFQELYIFKGALIPNVKY